MHSSLFVGILAGGLLYSNFSFEGTILHVFNDGIVSVLSDSYNVGILVFLVILGVMVCLMNKAGGSAAFGRWAAKNIKSRAGAQLATIALGILIFIDDYFNVMVIVRPPCALSLLSPHGLPPFPHTWRTAPDSPFLSRQFPSITMPFSPSHL